MRDFNQRSFTLVHQYFYKSSAEIMRCIAYHQEPPAGQYGLTTTNIRPTVVARNAKVELARENSHGNVDRSSRKTGIMLTISANPTTPVENPRATREFEAMTRDVHGSAQEFCGIA